MGTKELLVTVFGFGAGTLLRSFFVVSIPELVFLFALSGALLTGAFFVATKKAPVMAALCLALIGLGIIRTEFAFQKNSVSIPSGLLESSVELEGVIIDDPDERQAHTFVTVALDEPNTRIRVLIDRYPEFRYGDRVRIRGELEVPENFEGDTGRVFQYEKWLLMQGITHQMFRPTIEFVSKGEGNTVKRNLFAAKHALLSSLERQLPEPQSALAGGIILGTKQALGEELSAMFRATGIIHIVVLSGYNVTIIADAIGRSLRFLPFTFSLSLSALAIVFFALMTGASATIVRASIMALLVLLAKATGRVYLMTRALLAAALVMVLHNPLILAFDPSFQLSFIATLGLIFGSTFFENKLVWLPNTWGLRDIAIATIATQVLVLPLLLYLMGEFSLVALPVNLLVLLSVPLAMLFSFLAALTGLFGVIALPFSFVAHLLLSYMLFIVAWFAQLPFASVFVPHFSFIAVVFVYCVYGIVAWRLTGRKTRV